MDVYTVSAACAVAPPGMTAAESEGQSRPPAPALINAPRLTLLSGVVGEGRQAHTFLSLSSSKSASSRSSANVSGVRAAPVRGSGQRPREQGL